MLNYPPFFFTGLCLPSGYRINEDISLRGEFSKMMLLSYGLHNNLDIRG